MLTPQLRGASQVSKIPKPVLTVQTTTKLPANYVEVAVPRLTSLYGVGPKLAEELIQTLLSYRLIPRTVEGITNMKDSAIREALRDRRIYAGLPAATKMDLNERPLNRIPRKLIRIMEREIHKALGEQRAPGIKVVVAGSYLRGAATSGDIDLVLQTSTRPPRTTLETWAYFKDRINKNSNLLHIKEPFSIGADKVGAAFEIRVPPTLRDNEHIKDYIDNKFKVRFKVDTFLTTPAEFEFALLYATGSGIFNIRMRGLAKRKGFMLNQHGLYKIQGDRLVDTEARTQEDVFRILGMTYREPTRRNV